MGSCHSADSSASNMVLQALKKEKKLLLLGLTASIELQFVHRLQSHFHHYHHPDTTDTTTTTTSITKYQYGALSVEEHTPHDLVLHNIDHLLDDEACMHKLHRHWQVTDYDKFLRGWFRQHCQLVSFPQDLVQYMHRFCFIPVTEISSYKLRPQPRQQQHRRDARVMQFWNISSIYRKCWSQALNAHCFRHKELSFCFQRAAAIVFVVDVACYNELDDASGGNKMSRTIKLYQWLLKDYSLYMKQHKLKRGNILLVFENMESFKRKLVTQSVPLMQCPSFGKYDGAAGDYMMAKQWIVAKFVSMNVYHGIHANTYFEDEDTLGTRGQPEYIKRIQSFL